MQRDSISEMEIRMKKTINNILQYVIALCVVAGLWKLPCMAADTAPNGMSRVCENEYLILFIDESETDICVYDKESGIYWFSNPENAEEDPFASNYYKRALKSQIQIQFYNNKVQPLSMDNYNDSVMNGAFEIEERENGVTITYTLGKATLSLLLPDAISQERMEAFKEKMDASAAKKINRNYTFVEWDKLSKEDKETYITNYPGFENRPFYVLRGQVKDYLKEELATYFEAAGYTEEDLEADAAEAGGEESANDDPWFVIPLEYTLSGKNLIATVDPEKIDYNREGFFLVDLDFLPYFGAAYKDEDGYIFVPDGSGAIINFNNGKTNVSGYTANIYGQDMSKIFLNTKKGENDDFTSVKLPVFGIKYKDRALFAVVEEGAAYANVAADVSMKTSSYNNVYAGFSFLQYGPVSLDSMIGTNSYQLYSEEKFSSKYSVKYFFLGKADADYSGMAKTYREYLVENQKLQKKIESADPVFVTEYIGAVDTFKTVLGVRYDATEVLSTYKEAFEVNSRLKNLGIDNQKVIFDGWTKGGLHGNSVTSLSALSKLEKGMSLEAFIKAAKDAGIGTYFTEDFQYVYEDKSFDGYTTLAMAPEYFDHTTIVAHKFENFDGSRAGKLADLISPYFAKDVTEKAIKKSKKIGIENISLGTLSSTLYSDFLDKRYTDREAAVKIYEECMETLSKEFGLAGVNANAYALMYTDFVTDAPISSGNYKIIDADVPFYEMVLHGYVDYTSEALNMADDYDRLLLKSIETGAGLKFLWITRDNSLLKETEYDYLYNVSEETSFDRAVADYEKVREALSGLSDKVIISHEYVRSNVVRVTYEDGTRIYVNYGDKPVVVEDICIGAKDFAVKKGCE